MSPSRSEDKPPITMSNTFLGSLIIASFVILVPLAATTIKTNEFIKNKLDQYDKDILKLQKEHEEIREILYPKPLQFRQN